MLTKNSGGVLFRPDFFEERKVLGYEKGMRTVKPVIAFPEGKVRLGYDVSVRTNGVDKPVWPKDLMVEVVS